VRRLKAVLEWIEFRVKLGGAVRDTAIHPVPKSSASWWYVFGSAALTVFLLQVFTGVLLGLAYVPSAAEAWNSLQALNHDVTLGWFLRAVHGWGSNFMVAIVLIHMVQVFLFGAYKYPRELTWIVGVFLLVMTLGMAFTGQVLRFDQDAYWGLGVGASITGRVPLVGGALVHLLLGGPIIAGDTLSRFFALHVFVIPALLLGFAGVHLLMVLKLGISEWPMPGRLVRRETYVKEYEELTRQGVPFFPDAIWKDLVFGAAVVAAILVCAAVFGPFGPSGEPDPTMIHTVPRPDYFFLWLYGLLSLVPPQWETPILLIAPPIAVLLLLVLPLLASVGERSWRRRPVAVLTVLLLAVTLGSLTRSAQVAPWSPDMYAWSGDPVPEAYLKGRTPLERRGALVFQAKQCRSCHALGGLGGMRGPALDRVATRLTNTELIRQVLQGGGNMPAYGKNLNPAETAALVAFLQTLRPEGHAAAEQATARQ
jgi:ubiquinol-cytochrome c reductase cytochrome b subunit